MVIQGGLPVDTRARLLDNAVIALAIIIGTGSILLLMLGGSFTYTRFGWSERDVLLWDAFLSLLFFVQHSGMVRRSFRQWLTTYMPPLYHSAIYAIGSGIALAVVAVFWQRTETLFWSLQGSLHIASIVCTLLAFALFGWGVVALRSFDILGVGPIRARLRGTPHQPGPFVVRGPYRWVRHPLYSAILVLFWVNPSMTSDRLLFNVLWTAWVIMGTVLEERDLIREFGNLYVDYKRKVPMLIPWRRPVPEIS
jgi:methanethiol S-methyltransferase